MRRLLGGIFLALTILLPRAALAANCSSYPYTLTNGSTADANQVMANFNNILNCGNNNLAHNGSNADITSLNGLTTPITVNQGGTNASTASGARTNLGLGAAAVENLGGSVVDDGSGNLKVTTSGVSAGTYYAPQVAIGADGRVTSATSFGGLAAPTVFTGSGTWTAPSWSSASTIWKFTVTGGGGGGYAITGCCTGAAGGTAIYYSSGLAAGATVAVTVGGGGSANSSGGDSSVVVGATTVTAHGGFSGSNANPPGGTATNGTLNLRGGSGNGGITTGQGAAGGASYWGGGGDVSSAGAYGSGGGANATPSGGPGGAGVVVVEAGL